MPLKVLNETKVTHRYLFCICRLYCKHYCYPTVVLTALTAIVCYTVLSGDVYPRVSMTDKLADYFLRQSPFTSFFFSLFFIP